MARCRPVLLRRRGWLRRDAVFGDESIGIAMPRHRVQDIDTPEDWAMAERLFSLDLGDRVDAVAGASRP